MCCSALNMFGKTHTARGHSSSLHTPSNVQCNRTVALDEFFKQIIQYPVKIAWIGSGCSIATTPTAEISHQYNITQVELSYNSCQYNSCGVFIQQHSYATTHLAALMGPEKTTNSRLPFKISHLPLSPSSFPNLLCWFFPSSPQISCSSASPELRNRWRFRYYFQMLATADQLAQAFFAIVKEFQIQSRRVTIIEQNEKLFSVVSCMHAEL